MAFHPSKQDMIFVLPLDEGGPIEQDAGLGYDQRYGHACRRTEENQGSFAHHQPRTSWPSFTDRLDFWYPVLTELHVEYGSTARFGKGRFG